MKYDIVEKEGMLALSVNVVSPLGLHARPAAQLTKEAQKFEADIKVTLNGVSADAKSILDMMSLGAAQNSNLLFTADGPDALSALEGIARIFSCNFEE